MKDLKRNLFKGLISLLVAMVLVSGIGLPTQGVSAAKVIDGYTYTDDQVKVLNDINATRKAMGLPQVKMDIDLTNAAVGHSMYLYANDEIDHTQTKALFATQKTVRERIEAQAGTDFFTRKNWSSFGEVISYQSPKYSVRGLLDVPYHRDSLIKPNLVAIGAGTHGYHNTVINVASRGVGEDITETPVLYPYNGQKDVALYMKFSESPDPFQGTGLNQYKDTGYVLSASFNHDTTMQELTASLTDADGKNVDLHIKGRTNDKSEETTFWIFIPKEQLKPSTKYTFKVNNSTSTFTTMTATQMDNLRVGREDEYKKYVYEAPKDDLANKIPKKFPNKGFTVDNVGINLNGEYLTLSAPAKVIKGMTFVPLRGVLEKLGAKVSWNQKTQDITITKDNIEIITTIGDDRVLFYKGRDRNLVTLSKAPFVEKGVTYVPLRFLSETLGAVVKWDATTYTVGIGY